MSPFKGRKREVELALPKNAEFIHVCLLCFLRKEKKKITSAFTASTEIGRDLGFYPICTDA